MILFPHCGRVKHIQTRVQETLFVFARRDTEEGKEREREKVQCSAEGAASASAIASAAACWLMVSTTHRNIVYRKYLRALQVCGF